VRRQVKKINTSGIKVFLPKPERNKNFYLWIAILRGSFPWSSLPKYQRRKRGNMYFLFLFTLSPGRRDMS